jgi:glutamate/tyrosine decarboxylase-like PLP-dependent enzyme
MMSLGHAGYLEYARAIFATARTMRASVERHPQLRIMGSPTFLFSFTSDDFDVYHVNDFLRLRGWRLNGQQYPNALHLAVTRPQTQAGVAERWDADLADAVAYAIEHADETPQSSAVYGGVAGGMTGEADEFIRMMMAEMMDRQQDMPSPASTQQGA